MAGNFDKLLAQIVFNPPIMKYNSDLLDFWEIVPACQAGTYEILPAHNENYPPVAGGRASANIQSYRRTDIDITIPSAKDYVNISLTLSIFHELQQWRSREHTERDI